jgi:hypothetical protein
LDVGDAALLTGKRVGAWRKYSHLGSALVQLEPALIDRVLDAGAELRIGP